MATSARSTAHRWRVRSRGPLVRYAVAVVLVVAATLAQLALTPFLPPSQFLFFYPAVFAVGWYAGLGPGVFGTILSALALAYFFLPPSVSFAVSSPRDRLDLAIFVALAVGMLLMIHRLEQAMRARDRALRLAQQASSRLAEQGALLEAVIEQAPVALAFYTADGVLRLKNGSWRSLAGQDGATAEDAVRDRVLCWKDGRAISAEEWQGLLRQAEERVVEFEAQSAASIWVNGRIAPVSANHDTRLIGTVLVLRDVSAERRIAELREEFVAVITHDLRSPIAAIRYGLHAALRNRTVAQDTAVVSTTSLERMYRSAQRLGDMVCELLDASRVELRKLNLNCKETDFSRLVADLVEEVRPSLRGHAVVTDLPGHPLAVSVDAPRIAQVVTNLLDNASKYSRAASTIRVAVREGLDWAELFVTDEGPGIAPSDLPRLFDRFYQARKAREHRGGLGLGLYITKGIVDAHGGHLTVDSAEGVGSTFRIALPARRPATE